MRKYRNEAIVVIDSNPRSAVKYKDDYAIVCVDVIRSTTTAVTAVAMGRRCFPAGNLEHALELSITLAGQHPLLAGELGGRTPRGFELNNSPVAVSMHNDLKRPLILLSSSGTPLIGEASGGLATFLACLRNMTAAAEFFAGRYRKVAVIGAGSRNEFREEDQYCCARIAEILTRNGFRPGTRKTKDVLEKWRDAPVDSFMFSKSVEFLKQTQQEHDLNFTLSHVDDLNSCFMMADGEVLMIPDAARSRPKEMRTYAHVARN